MTWGLPRFGNDSSIATQFEGALLERFAIALRQNGNLASPSRLYGVGHPLWSERPMHRRVGSIEWHVNVLASTRITDVQVLTIKPQRQLWRRLEKGRVLPFAGKIIGTRNARGDELTHNDAPTRMKRGCRHGQSLSISRKLPMICVRLYAVFHSGAV